ncbi:hypothetical protein PENTCL1PPCAC_6292, partial [Pristionchus entomophagus]
LLCRSMRFLSLLLLLSAAVAAIPEEVEIERVETLVALNAPKSEENEGDTKKARLTFFDDIGEVKSIGTKEPQLRYVSPKEETTSATAAATTAAATEATPITSTVATTTSEPVPTSTSPAAITTTEAVVEKKVEKLENATHKPILIPIPLPNKEILQAIVETSEPILIQLPYLPKVAGVLTAGQSIQGTPWGTESMNDQKGSSIPEFTVPPPIEIGSELDMGETSPFLPGHSLLSQVITPIEEKKEEKKMSPEDMERAQILMTALRAMKSEVEETLRQINEGERTVRRE